jgi:hypothetical protein
MSSNKIKIGILSKKIEDFRSFEYKIIDEILKDENFEIKALFLDGRKRNKSNFIQKFFSFINNKNLISRLFLKIQEITENIIFQTNFYSPSIGLLEKINSIDKIYLYPEKKGFLDIFSFEDSKEIKNINVDLLIRTEFNIIRGDILDCLKYGIWSFHHGDNRVNRGGPPCFWELIEKHKNVGVTLQKLTADLDGGYVIDRGSYNPHWSWVMTKRKVYDSSVSLLIKNLNLLKSKSVNFQESPKYYNEIYKFPSLKYTLIYVLRFYRELILKAQKKIYSYLFSIRYNHWSLVMIKGDFLASSTNENIIIESPKKEFWADPFFIDFENIKYVFFENYDYKLKIGKISSGKILDNKIVEVRDSLVKDYHLSYPFIYQKDGDMFMIPETSKNKRLEVYKCDHFPEKWSLYSTAFHGEEIIDCNVYSDRDNKTWLFLNKKKHESDNCSDLYIYLVDSLKFNKITPHKLNPVITDATRARNAGPIFSYEEKIFRPSQININGQYGSGINFNEILNLSITNYKERIYKKYLPDLYLNYTGLHHIHFNKDFSVFDLCLNKRF